MQRQLNLSFFGLLLALLAALHVSLGEDEADIDDFEILELPLNVRAWQNLGNEFYTFPESKYLSGKSNTGIGFSGGGTRSYAATLGYMRGLLDLGLLNRTRYVASVSGGSWASLAYTFNQLTDDGDVRRFLGAITPPERVNWVSLYLSPRDCARSFPVRQNLILKSLWLLLADTDAMSDTWFDAVSSVFLEPAGIGREALYSWNMETWNETVKRNPVLQRSVGEKGLVLPCKGNKRCDNRPYPIINTAMLGPWRDAPFTIRNRTFTMLEWTPLYMGFGKTLNITYMPSKESNLVGGYIEPIGFGGGVAKTSTSAGSSKPKQYLRNYIPDQNKVKSRLKQRQLFGESNYVHDDQIRSLKPNQTSGFVHVTPAPAFYTLANATGASSWAPGSLFADTPFLELLDEYVGLKVDYKSPALLEKFETTETSTLLLADAGSLENQGLMSLLKRRLERIVLFVNSPVPLKPRSRFNPFHRDPVETDIDSGIASYFGYHIRSSTVQTLGADLSRNQVFPKHVFPELVTRLQEAQALGKGIVVTMEMVTVLNEWWGIPAGLNVTVTWVYLGRVLEWERRLRNEFSEHVLPEKEPEDPTKLRKKGVFAKFPHFETSDVQLTAPQTNLLSDLAGWTVLEHAQLFREALD